ncbi:MAG: MarR family transcriptional regulator, partial [Pigmentiphaga sp.]
KTLADGLNALPELEQATITLALERIVDLVEVRDPAAAPVTENSPFLDMPVGDQPAESGLAV